jgi:hypothetical protein
MENKSQTRGLKPFVKGDVRINRSGRPRGFDEMRKMALRIACEMVTLQNGRRMSVIEALLRSWVCSKEPALQIKFMEIAFGKVPDAETTGLENRPTLILHYAHERPDLLQSGGPINAVNGEGTRRPLLPDAD